MNEEVLVFPRAILTDFYGVFSFSYDLLEQIIANASFIHREQAEISDVFKQIIPYCVIFCDDRLLSYKRTKKATESRLQELYSVGIGGHINPEDLGGSELEVIKEGVIYNCAKREIKEELGIDFNDIGKDSMEIIGFLNDDTNPVGYVHFGVVLKIQISKQQKQILQLEDALESLDFMELEQYLKDRSKNFESWSELVLKFLGEKGETRCF